MPNDFPTLPLRHPVVLVHGLGGLGVIREVFGSDVLRRIDYFNGIADLFASHGVPRIYQPLLPPTAGIAERAAALAGFIQSNVPEPRIHLVAHSMGGLDSRFYVSCLGGASRVVSLTTLGTPHLGSPLASLAVNLYIKPQLLWHRLRRKRDRLDQVAQLLPGHRDLTVRSCRRLAPTLAESPAVRYFSYAGAPPPDMIHWVLRPTWNILRFLRRREPNDGLVSLDSARGAGWRGAVPLDHLGLLNWQMDAAREKYDAHTLYAEVLANLSKAENPA